MKSTLPLLSLTLLLTCALACTSCGTRNARIQESYNVFGALDPRDQELIRTGQIDLGFTSEMVRMALGTPNTVTRTEDMAQEIEVWSYRNYLYTASSATNVGNAEGTRVTMTVLTSSSAPRGGPSLFSTKAGPWQPQVSSDASDSMGTLYIKLLEGRVVAAAIGRR